MKNPLAFYFCMCYNELYLKRIEEVWRVASVAYTERTAIGCKQFCVSNKRISLPSGTDEIIRSLLR